MTKPTYVVPATKRIVSLECLTRWLKQMNYPFADLHQMGSDGPVTVVGAEGAPDPKTMIDAYVNPDYYDIVCDKPREPKSDLIGSGYLAYRMSLGGSVTFTVTKRKGLDNSVLPHADTFDFHWHGAQMGQAKTLTLANGVVSYTITNLKRTRVIVEAVPTGSTDLNAECPALLRTGLILVVG